MQALHIVLDRMLHLLLDLAVQSRRQAVTLIAWVVDPG